MLLQYEYTYTWMSGIPSFGTHWLEVFLVRLASMYYQVRYTYMYWTTSCGVPGSAADYNRMAVYLTVERPRPNLYAS